MPPEAFSSDSELSRALKELYEVPGGDQVDGSPLAPVRRQAKLCMTEVASLILSSFRRQILPREARNLTSD
eukprot:7807121-Pyramimonas_sp.AAC.1